MSTNDVPGTKASNADELGTGCWAEHEDGSLIFVESTEGGRVIYSIFDLAYKPPLEYRDAMPEKTFKSTFSWQADDNKAKKIGKWTWHDKTAFPWDRIIKQGAKEGVRHVTADDQMSAAAKVAESLRLKAGRVVNEADVGNRAGRVVEKAKRILGRLRDALEDLDDGSLGA